MNASKFMDKQIMDLSRSNDDFIDLMNPNPSNDNTEESAGVTKKEDILPNYDFQPIRPAGGFFRSSDSLPMGGGSGGGGDGDGDGGLKAWSSADSKPNSSPTRSYGYLGSVEPDKVVLEKAHSVSDAAIVSEIDRTMKRHTDNLLHAIDGLSARLSQVESRTRQLEHSVDDLKASIGNNHGSTDGKMRQLENILRELQSSVLDLKDKQDVMNARIQLEKLQISEVDRTPETQNAAHISPAQQTAPPAPQQSTQQFPAASPQSLPGVSPNAPPPPPQQSINPPMQLPNQYPSTPMPAVPQRDTYFPSPGQTQEAPTQQYMLPPAHPQQPQTLPPPPGVQHQQYQPTPPTPYPHGPQPPQQYQQPIAAVSPPPPQLQPPMGHHSEEAHIPSQTYPPALHQPPCQPTSGPPSQQFYGAPPPPSHMYDSPTSRSGSGFFSSVYNQPATPNEAYPYSGSSSHYGSNPGTKLPPHSSGSGGNYPQIPTARVLPQAIPAAAAVGGGPSLGGSGNRVPIDDVIDKVTNMGFSREQVKGTVRKLTENGQPVDLNVVLDKLMNDSDVLPPRGWFGR